jgi:hypothetical protein
VQPSRQLAVTPAIEPEPRQLAVSPDGLQIACRDTDSLTVAPASGGEPRAVIRWTEPRDRVRAGGVGLAWSRDQRYLFFVQPGVRAIWRVPVAGGQAVSIGVSMNGIGNLHVHPDGRRIMFDSVVHDLSEVWALEDFLPKPTARK